MIIIYHIPGRKVGCTKNIRSRIAKYRNKEGVDPEYEVLEELHDITDQEAGDREWAWADKLGYKRGIHYSVSVKRSHAGGRRSVEIVLPEQYKEWAQKGGLSGGQKGGFTRKETTTFEQRQEWGRIGGSISGKIVFNIRDKCPHCGLESQRATLYRWHFDNCPKKG